MKRPDDLRELCYEYAMGVLEGEERDTVEALLAEGDEETLRELKEAAATIAELGAAAPEARPPESVKTKLFDRLGAEQAREAGSAIVPPPPSPKVKAFPMREALGWAIAAGLLVFAYLANQQKQSFEAELHALSERVDRIEGERDTLAAENTLLERMQSILSSPETRGVELTSDADPRVQAFWNEQQGLFVAGADLPRPGEGRTLQLWIVPLEGNPISLGLFEPDENGRALYFAEPQIPIEDAAAIAISDEPDAGSPAPTSTPVWVGPLN